MQILLSSDENFIFGNCDSQLGINVIDENARLGTAKIDFIINKFSMIPLGISYNDNYLISTDFDRSYNVYVIDLVRANKNWDQIQVVAQITDSMA